MHHCRHYITSFLTRKKFQKCNRIKNLTTVYFNHILVAASLVLIFLIKGSSPWPTIQMINTNEIDSKLQLRNFNQTISINEIIDYHQRTDSEFLIELNFTICDFHTEMFKQFSQDNAYHRSCCRLWCSIGKISKRIFCVLDKRNKVFSIPSSTHYRSSKGIRLHGAKFFFWPYHYSLDIRINEDDISVMCFVHSGQIRYITNLEDSTLYINRSSTNHKRNRTRYKRYASERGNKVHDIVSRGSNGIRNNAIKL